MAVDVAIKLFRQLEGIMHVLDAHIASPFIVWNASYDIAAQFHGLAHQLAPIGKRQNAVLGKGHQLQVANIAHLLSHFDQGTQRSQIGITDIHVAANVQCSLRHLPANLLEGAFFDILGSQTGLAFTPDLDAFQQRPRRIVTRLPHREYGIKMDMCINERGRNESTGSIDLASSGIGGKVAGNSGKVPILNSDIDKTLMAVKLCMTNDEIIMHKKFLFYLISLKSSWPYSSSPIGARQEKAFARPVYDRDSAVSQSVMVTIVGCYCRVCTLPATRPRLTKMAMCGSRAVPMKSSRSRAIASAQLRSRRLS